MSNETNCNIPSSYIIVGGEFNNKGAQAMTFTVMNELRNHDADANIIMASSFDYGKERREYDTKIIPISLYSLLYASGLVPRFLGMFGQNVASPCYAFLRNRKRMVQTPIFIYNNELKNAKAVIDISGFALSSKWGIISSLTYILKICSAKQHGVPYYILPQSFGPFTYPKYCNFLIQYILKKYLPYPNLIFAREQEGFNDLSSITTLPNLQHSPDLVLQSQHLTLSNIYTTVPDFIDVPVLDSKDNVAIVPNLRITDKIEGMDIEKLLELYKQLINVLLQKNKTVYLVIHAGEDRAINYRIKETYKNNDSVVDVPDELNCFEYENFIRKCDFVIASRYHSIVHAYKQNVPSLVFGWAVKYEELTTLMSQERYYHDMRQPLSISRALSDLEYLIQNHLIESEIIQNRLHEIQKHSCFDELFARMK